MERFNDDEWRLTGEDVRIACIVLYATIAGYALAVATAMWAAGLLYW